MNWNIKTFGCKLNTYDSGLLQKQLAQTDFVDLGKKADIHILNSCAVTTQATTEVLRQARRIKSKNPLATVVLTGCAAQVDGCRVDSFPAVDLVVANSHKDQLKEILKNHLLKETNQKVFRSNIFRNETLGEGGGEEFSHTRSYLKIQDGCNSFCSFCVIPFARGKSRSLSVPMILSRVRQLEARGFKEVVLTGVHIGDYQDDQSYGGPFGLDDLVEQLLLNSKIPRIRLSSLEPVELTEKLMSLFKNPRLCPHFHMSLQSLCTNVLKAMNRKYGADQVKEALYWISSEYPHAFVGLDVITGFPAETEEFFSDTYENLKAWPWTRIHVFPYSERPGTRAANRKEKVPWSVRKQRASLLRKLSQKRYDRIAESQLGEKKQVLFLKEKPPFVQALSRDYWDILVKGKHKRGTLGTVKIQNYQRLDKDSMKGVLIGE